MLIGLFENIYKRKGDWFVTIQFLAGFLIYVVFSWKLSLGQAAGFLRHLISLSPLAAYLAVVGYNYWLDFEADKERKVRVLIYSIIILILTALFLSRKLVMHHIVSQEPEYVKMVIISLLSLVFIVAAYIDRSLFKNSAVKMFLAIMIVGTAMVYTLTTEPPNNNDSTERQVMKQVSKWYVDNNLLERKTYANHIWFFYASDLDYNSDHFERVTMENLDNAPPSSIVIWESHYSHRLFGDVQLDYFKDNPKFEQITQVVTPDRRFAVFIFQVVS
jgi:thiol:disulfide interchange protein